LIARPPKGSRNAEQKRRELDLDRSNRPGARATRSEAGGHHAPRGVARERGEAAEGDEQDLAAVARALEDRLGEEEGEEERAGRARTRAGSPS